MPDEKHKIMIALEEEFHTAVRNAISSWENRTGVYIRSIKYYKDTMHESLEILTELSLGKGIR